MQITSKGNDKADISFTHEEMGRFLSITQEVVNLLNKRFEGYPVSQLMVFTGFLTANMARWFSQSVVHNDGRILSEDEFADVICNQAKSFLHQIPEFPNG